MWLVRIALRRPYTFVVMAMLIAHRRRASSIAQDADGHLPGHRHPGDLGASGTTAASPPTRWRSASSRNFERNLTTTVNDIEHIESQSLTGIAIIKIFFQPGADIDAGDRAGDGDLAVRGAPDAAGHDAAVHHPLQRVERADHAGRARERLAPRAAALRLRHQLRPRGDGDDPRRADPVAVRRQAAPDHGRHRPAAALRAAGSRRATSTPRSASRTSSCRPARRRWARTSTRSA